MTNNVDKLLADLSRAARSEPAPSVEVSEQVMRTLTHLPFIAPVDYLPIVFAGAALALAAIILVALFPAWQSLSEPWAAYLP
ncbi:MAG: hypothetical protein IT423_00455 [Pirellulaceae bacterium]|nr:hypothetical protein [Pirellulaceae bacterium]